MKKIWKEIGGSERCYILAMQFLIFVNFMPKFDKSHEILVVQGWVEHNEYFCLLLS